MSYFSEIRNVNVSLILTLFYVIDALLNGIFTRVYDIYFNDMN